MQQYLNLLRHVLDSGVDRNDRTGVGTRSVFGYQMRFRLADGFPLLTTKRISFKIVLNELLWFLSGSTNVTELRRNGVSIWDPWADKNGSIGPSYGKQWRSWDTLSGPIDQLSSVLEELKANPFSRRLIVSSWNVADIPQMSLPPCHVLFQFYVADERLSCHLYQRSADIFIGLPFNIASYSMLTMMIANSLGLKYGELIHSLGDAHLYSNHLSLAELQLKRKPVPLPTLSIKPTTKSLFDHCPEDFSLSNYKPHPHISAPVAN